MEGTEEGEEGSGSGGGEAVDRTGEWRLGVLDFGTVDRLPGGLPEIIGESLRLTLSGEAEAVYELLRGEGFVKETIDLDPDAVLDYLLPIIEPAQVEEFTFTRSWMRNQAARIADPRSPAHQLGKQLNLPPAYLLIHRVTLSTIGVLCQLNATVRLRDELEAWLPGFLPQDEPDTDGVAGDGPAESGPADGGPEESRMGADVPEPSGKGLVVQELAGDAPSGA